MQQPFKSSTNSLKLGLLLSCLLITSNGFADPEADRQAIREFYTNRFPDVPLEAHKDGAYALNAGKREQWLEIEDFPPYEIAVDEGQELFDTPFANGKSYADCFPDGGIAVKQNYPYFDTERGSVVTLEMAVNQCREDNGEDALDYSNAEFNSVIAYMAFTSRGKVFDIKIPDDPRALAAYEDGKRFFSSRRGQLNFACSSCHAQIVGNLLRAETLSAALGHPTHFPAYRFKWQEVGGMHRRFQECNTQVRAEPFALQSEPYRNLEYFLSYISNGMELNGPATRK